MAAKKRSAVTGHQPMYTQLVLFPERAEFLGEARFGSYEVSLDHWAALSASFRNAFEIVFERSSARVLLVHGAQGNGKSLFVRRLDEDFTKLRERVPDGDNLWFRLAGGADGDAATGERAVAETEIRRVEPTSGWLQRERDFARESRHAMRVFLFDDAQKDAFVREWAGLTQGEYMLLRAQDKTSVALKSVAERVVEDSRGAFKRSIFVLLSNDASFLDELKTQLDRLHGGLAERIELPLPVPRVKEEIVRTNTNKLNQRSYWFCLDQGGPDEKRDAYQTLMGDRGFIDSFQAINRALASQSKRSGRPANKNLLTLVTLGSAPADVVAFLADHELQTEDAPEVGAHVGVWYFRKGWASALRTEVEDHSRRASLVESEFALRWVALDMAATWVLCSASSDDAAATALVDVIKTVPSIADKKAAKVKQRSAVTAVDEELSARAKSAAVALGSFGHAFRVGGQARSREYEPAIARRLGRALSQGLKVRGALKPDVVMEEYTPCAVTEAANDDPKAIEQAIRRGCHVIELTAYLQEDMRGLDEYLSDKVRVYAELLESV